MSLDLVTIRPGELEFAFEIKQQSSCSIQLINNTEEHVAFKVKTTSPKKYCVRPNIGVILPKSTCEFTVTMQAQKIAPPEMQCKDKFLVQSTVVPSGSTEDDLTSSLFSKVCGKYIQENKMRVVLVSPLNSPLLAPMNGDLKQDQTTFDTRDDSGPVKQESTTQEEPSLKETPNPVSEDGFFVISRYPKEEQEVSSHHEGQNPMFGPKEARFDEAIILETKLHDLERNLHEKEKVISRLIEEKNAAMMERNLLKQELVTFKSKENLKVQVGFPPLFVCFVALVCMYLGFLLSS